MPKAAWRGCQGQLPLLRRRAVLLLIAFLAGAASLAAQVTSVLVNPSPGRLSFCNAGQLQQAGQLTFRQRACWSASELVSPGAAARAAFSSGIGQWRNAPFVKGQDADDYLHRFAAYYVRRSARETGELFAGYLNHEDPRPHSSTESVFGKRVRSALLSVLIVKTDEGDRPALVPIAGALASGFAGAACYREHTRATYALEGAGASYSGYFGRALYQEFRPAILSMVRRMLHKPPG